MPPLPDFPRLPPVRQSAMHHQGRWNAVASCHAQTSRSSSVVRITEITGLNECQIDQVPRAISWEQIGSLRVRLGGMFAYAPCWRAGSLIQSASTA